MIFKLSSTFLFLVLIVRYVHPQVYTRLVTLPLSTSLQEQLISPQSVIYVSTPSPPPPSPRPIRNRKTSRKRPRPVVEQFLKEVTPTTKTLFNDKQIVSTTERRNRITGQDYPSYSGQKYTNVAIPAVQYFSYLDMRPTDTYTNVRSSSRKTNPYLPTSTRFQEIDPVKELLLYRQGVEVLQKEMQRLQRAKYEDDVSHIVGYFSVSHEGIVPKDRSKKEKNKKLEKSEHIL